MCDTLVALANSTADGSVLFAKNSDREPNEAHQIDVIPALDTEDETVQCTYINIPQVKHTHAILLCKPFWIWGAEMGANEYGVTIGNEAVFTRAPLQKEPGLIGMDFLRLALERSTTAEEALKVIVNLLEQYGQGGNCGFLHSLYYHNSFIIADTREAWVLETADRQWAAEKVKTIRAISNNLSIETHIDASSSDLEAYAREQGWHKNGRDFNFKASYAQSIIPWAVDSDRRRETAEAAMNQHSNKLTAIKMMNILRSHNHKDGRSRKVDHSLIGANLCMHAGIGPARGSQSVGSLVSHLSQKPSHWITGTSAPCTSIFKPVWIEAGLPEMGPAPDGEFDENSYFWQHELLHREMLRNLENNLLEIQTEQQYLERAFYIEASNPDLTTQQKLDISQRCFQQAREVEYQWLVKIKSNSKDRFHPLYSSAWEKFNRLAKF